MLRQALHTLCMLALLLAARCAYTDAVDAFMSGGVGALPPMR